VALIRAPQTLYPGGGVGDLNLKDTEIYCRFFQTGFNFSDQMQDPEFLL
jgi:hypothetical protein